MAAFSIGGAVGSGFRVIRDHPVAVLVWGLTYFVVTLAPMLAVGAAMVPDFMKLSELTAADTTSDTAAIEAALTLQVKMMLLQAVQFVSTIAGASILYAAVFRAVLEPQEKRRWYLRLGRQEMWLAFVWMVSMALAMMAMFVGIIPLGIAGSIAGAMTGGLDPVSWIILAGLGAGVLGILCWAAIRLALAFPMTFAERKFQMFESWGLTRGHAGRMALTFLSVLALVWLIELIAFGLFVGLGFGVLAVCGVTIPWNQGPEAQMTAPPGGWAPFLFVVIPVAALALSIVVAAVNAIAVAPLAYVYRRLQAAQPSG